MGKKQTYLVCPLNWGLGHASRMIPIVYDLIKDGNIVILGGDGDALKLISDEFPQLKTIHIPDIKVLFRKRKMIYNLLGLVPRIIYSSIKEHILLKKIIRDNKIDVIISDNRYGLWSKKVKSILVTHQLMLKLPSPFKIFEYPTHLTINLALKKFNECWVPDYFENKNSLSGDLSHKYKNTSSVKFINPLSRFKHVETVISDTIFDIVVILSGPEPLRTQLENKIIDTLSNTKKNTIIIQGKPDKKAVLYQEKNIHFISHLSTGKLKHIAANSQVIICRSGYSSIMDLEYLKTKAILIPTPGQTEQEYLAKHLKDRFTVIEQKNFLTRLPEIIDF